MGLSSIIQQSSKYPNKHRVILFISNWFDTGNAVNHNRAKTIYATLSHSLTLVFSSAAIVKLDPRYLDYSNSLVPLKYTKLTIEHFMLKFFYTCGRELKLFKKKEN